LTYQVFARKWRPKSFSELVGQEPIKLALSHSLKTGRIHHAYLFCGTRGVGKTTLGRLLAKCLNCEQGVTAEPCGRCAACTSIDAGNFLDLIEVDAASKTRVEDTRELLDNVQYAPTQGRYKIYLIDEVHMLSTHSFNALLKTLEEPPEHVKFILATTDPEKIPATILSRCLKFVLRPIPESLIVDQLIKILEQENIAFEKTALLPIAVAAQGSMRDALSLLEQAVLVGEGVLGNKEVEQLLGWVAPQVINALLQAICKQDARLVTTETAHLVKIGADFTQVLDSLLEALYHISLIQNIVSTGRDISADLNLELGLADIALDLKSFTEQLSLEATQLFYQIALVGKQELAFAPSQRIGFEMTLLRMLAFYPADTNILSIEHIQENKIREESPCITAPRSAPAMVSAPVASVNSPRSFVPENTNTNQIGQINWPSLITKLSLVGFTKMLANNCELKLFSDSLITLTLDKSQQVCLTPERQKNLEEALSSYFKKSIKLKIELGQVTHTPMQLDSQDKQLRSEAAMKAIQNDSLVQNMVNTFGAAVESVTILDSALESDK
jgi:DNA polymerase-3 subunit gamma/tau